MLLPRRRLRRLAVVSCICVAFIVFVAAFYKAFTFGGFRPTSAGTVTTVTIYERETSTQEAVIGRKAEEPIQSHSFRSDGLLEVNPNGRHPIYDLIERAEAEWDKKMKRQSRTLDEAVVEYKRRYRRAPPKGFDEWWLYCEENNVQLPDEYDRIYHDLEPYWGMDPVDLNRLQAEHESHKESYTIGKTEDSEITLVASALAEPGPGSPRRAHLSQAKEIMGLLTDVQKSIPPFRAVFSPHDTPNMPTDWELKAQALQAAAAGTYIDIKQPPPVKHFGWPSACSPDSPLRNITFNLDVPLPGPTKKTFIYDHLKAMDPCNHPSLLYQNGEFLSHNHGPIPDQVMLPQFTYCSTLLHNDIVPATPINWVEDVYREDDPDFEDKVDERLLWRGTTTGMWHAHHTRWRSQQRIRLVGWANQRDGTASVLPPTTSKNERVGKGKPIPVARLNPAMMDVTFAGKPHTCDEDVCKMMKDQFEFRDMQTLRTAGNYKYLLDVDGNGWSARYKRLLVSRALIFKSTVFPEWYQERIQPWKHYVPVQLDWSDLYDSLTFFRGDLNGEGNHEDLAYEIASAGREWSKTFWREEDLTAYMFRLFLEYARVMSLDREAMSYKPK